MPLESRTPHWPGGQRLRPRGPAWKREESTPRPKPLCFLYFVSSHTEIKCKFLSLSRQNPTLLHTRGLSLFQQQERGSRALRVELSSRNQGGFVPFLFPAELGCLMGAPRQQTPPSPQRPRGATLRAPRPPRRWFSSEPPPHPRPPATARQPRPLVPESAPGTGQRSRVRQPPGRAAKLGEPAGPGSRSFLEDILALCLHRGAALPGNMAVTAGG